MKHSNRLWVVLISSLGAITAQPALAADPHAGHAGHAMPMSTMSHAEEMSEGTVTKLDAATGKLTIKHGPLKNLGMPPMTMVFKAKDAALLKGLKAGDKVQFMAEQEGTAYVVTRIAAKK